MNIMLPEKMGGYTLLRIVDNVLFYICVGFTLFALYISLGTLYNVRTKTSMPNNFKQPNK